MSWSKLIVRFKSDQRGVAAVEFALISTVLAYVLVNVADVVTYMYDRMEVQTAADLGAMAVLKTCDMTHIPASTQCSGVGDAIATSIAATSLGSAVALSGNSFSEAYYCVDPSNTLVVVSDIRSKPSDCSAAGSSNLKPADYVKVQVSYRYTPMFGGLSVSGLLANPITQTSMMRIG